MTATGISDPWSDLHPRSGRVFSGGGGIFKRAQIPFAKMDLVPPPAFSGTVHFRRRGVRVTEFELCVAIQGRQSPHREILKSSFSISLQTDSFIEQNILPQPSMIKSAFLIFFGGVFCPPRSLCSNRAPPSHYSFILANNQLGNTEEILMKEFEISLRSHGWQEYLKFCFC